MKKIVAVLDTMWGGEGHAPRFFCINPYNHSGRRLYRLIGGDAKRFVTNACCEYVNNARKHGNPDPDWLAENLRRLEERIGIDVLLVCGKIAQRTYRDCGYRPKNARVLKILHPAARTWTKAKIKRVSRRISKA